MCSGISWPGKKSTRVNSTCVIGFAGAMGKLPIGVRTGIAAASASVDDAINNKQDMSSRIEAPRHLRLSAPSARGKCLLSTQSGH